MGNDHTYLKVDGQLQDENDDYDQEQFDEDQEQVLDNYFRRRFQKRVSASEKIMLYYQSNAIPVRSNSIEKLFLSPLYIIIFAILLLCTYFTITTIIFPFGFRPLATLYPHLPTNQLIDMKQNDPMSYKTQFFTMKTSTSYFSPQQTYLFASIPNPNEQPLTQEPYFPLLQKPNQPQQQQQQQQQSQPTLITTSSSEPTPTSNPNGYITACLPPVTSPLFPQALRALLFLSKRSKRTILLMKDQPSSLTNNYGHSWGGRYSDAHWRLAEFMYHSTTPNGQIDEIALKKTKSSFRAESRHTTSLFPPDIFTSLSTIDFTQLFDLNSLSTFSPQKGAQSIEFLPNPPPHPIHSKCVDVNTFHVCLTRKPFSKLQRNGVVFDTCDTSISDSDAGYRCTNCPFHVPSQLPKTTYLRQQATPPSPQPVLKTDINTPTTTTTTAGAMNVLQDDNNNNNNNNGEESNNESTNNNNNNQSPKTFLYQFLDGHFFNFNTQPFSNTKPIQSHITKEKLTLTPLQPFYHSPMEIQTTSIRDFEYFMLRESIPENTNSFIKMIHLNSLTLASYGFYLEEQQSNRPNKELRTLLQFFPAFNNMVRFEALSIQQALVNIGLNQRQTDTNKVKERSLTHDGDIFDLKPSKKLQHINNGDNNNNNNNNNVIEEDHVSEVQPVQPNTAFIQLTVFDQDVDKETEPGEEPTCTSPDTSCSTTNESNDNTTNQETTTPDTITTPSTTPDTITTPSTTPDTTTTPTTTTPSTTTNSTQDQLPVDEWYDEWDPRHPEYVDLDTFNPDDLIEIEDESSGGTIRHWWYDSKNDQFYEEDTEEPAPAPLRPAPIGDDSKNNNNDNNNPRNEDNNEHHHKEIGNKISIIDKNGNKIPINIDDESDIVDNRKDNNNNSDFDTIIPPPRNQKLQPKGVGSICGLIYNIPTRSIQQQQLQHGKVGTLHQIAQWILDYDCAVIFIQSHSLNSKNDNKYNRSFFTQNINQIIMQQSTIQQPDRLEPNWMWGCEKFSLCGFNVAYEFGVTTELLSSLPHILIHPANFSPKFSDKITTPLDTLDPLADAVLARRFARETNGSVSWITISQSSTTETTTTSTTTT